MKAVADTSSLIHPAKTPKFWNLIKQTFDEILIPEAVYQEILRGREIGSPDVPIIEEEIANGWIKIKKVKSLLSLPDNLGKGEKGAISLMREAKADWLLIDDRAASTTARSKRIEIRSTAYLLIFWKRKNMISQDETLKLLDNIIEAGYHLSSKDYLIIKKHITASTDM